MGLITCRNCGEEITFDGTRWVDFGDILPHVCQNPETSYYHEPLPETERVRQIIKNYDEPI